MSPSSWFSVAEESGAIQVLWQEEDTLFCRVWRDGSDGDRNTFITVLGASDHPSPNSINRLTHEYGLKECLDGSWAIRPLQLIQEHGRTILVLEDPGGELLSQRVGTPIEVENVLRVAINIAAAISKMHQRGLVHKDIKPANILVNGRDGEIRLTGFGMASRLPRERQSPTPPEFIAGTLAYMAPEQTGRMNRSIDSRSDLYALGVTLYQMLTGSLPFAASEADPMEWVHCHVARKPPAPCERQEGIPAPISAIVMKLLAKTAEDRYQTALGLERDLRRCLGEWTAQRRIEAFPLGERDSPGRLMIPEKLYGRSHEIEFLAAAFDRALAGDPPNLVLVSGYSGIGKSSVVNELHKVLVPPRGLFASGKFDQYKRDIPYSTLAQALQRLIRALLSKSEADLSPWRLALCEALGVNGRLLTDLVPELKLIIGEQPAVPDLPPRDAQLRFQLLFRRFIGVFARSEHPLALFLDDLQWLDAATLDLLEDLLTHRDVQHLLLIGAYRSNEVDAAHALRHKLDAIKAAGAAVHEITLGPLTRGDVVQLVADALRCAPDHATTLAQLVHEKTFGNPFFTIQFINTLAEEELITFDHGNSQWSWDLNRIHAKGYTDNIVDLMVGKLSRLPSETLEGLQQLACLGSSTEIAMLSIVLERSPERVHTDLWEAVRLEFVRKSGQRYAFVHDRVHEASYSLIPNERRAEAHLRIGRLLIAKTPADRREDVAFEIVNHLNRGAALIASREERTQLAELNLAVGKRAKNATAYASALKYFAQGILLLPDDPWERNYALTFALSLGEAECEYLCGSSSAARERLDILAHKAVDLVDRAAVVCVQIDLYTNSDQADRAIQVALDFLRHAGIFGSMHPSDAEVTEEFERIWRQLGDRSIEELVELNSMVDPVRCAILDVLTAAHAPANFIDANLLALMIGRMVNLSIEHGNGNGSPLGYVYLGMILQSRFGEYDAGFRFGKAGVDLVERAGLDRFKAYAYLNFGNAINPWTRHVRTSLDLLRTALNAANEAGHLTVAAYTHSQLITAQLAAGDALDDVERFAESALAFMRHIGFGTGIDLVLGNLGYIRALRGQTSNLTLFSDPAFAEIQFEEHLAATTRPAMSVCWYWIRKLQACFLAGDHVTAMSAAAKAESLLWSSPGFLIVADYYFYTALVEAACYAASPDRPADLLERLKTHHQQIEVWAGNCAENFKARSLLVAAEIARIEGRNFEAMHLYEDAVRLAREYGFLQNEALANELASQFYAARGFERIARGYLRDAHYGYLRWGAAGKVRQLDDLHPYLREERQPADSKSTMLAPVQHLDLGTVIKVSQAVSSEIVLERLIDTLMRTAIEHAGAERGLLILPRGDGYRIEAEAATGSSALTVDLRRAAVTAADLPQSIFHYVVRTGESVLLDDAAGENPFSADDYIRARRARSILCLPLVHQTRVNGVLYLENNLAFHVFTPARMAVLKILASQAATSLENTRLYGDLQEREARVRRLVDANIIGIFIWDVEGRIIDANDAFLQTIGYGRDDVSAGTLRWTELTAAEWRGTDQQRLADVKATGVCQPYEKEFLKRDGSRVPVLVGAAIFDGAQDQGLAFVLDLTLRKQAEEAARESERRYQEVQLELAHANRVETMGQLTASIAHEVNQPLAATIINAEAALRWLARQQPGVEKARESIERIINDGKRAADIVDRVRALVKKAPARRDGLQINEAIVETIGLMRSELSKHGVRLQTQFTEGLPLIQGDRVQLQQVVLNLIKNAIEAMGQMSDGRQELLISTGTEAGCVMVAVRDSGPGLSQVALEQVFEAFYTTKSTGLGMGLSICRSIVEAHGGRLWASINVPRGATFQFTVPIPLS